MFQKLKNLLGWLLKSRKAKLLRLETRLGVDPGSLSKKINLRYRWHAIKKRDGSRRLVFSPNPELKRLQRLLAKRVFSTFKIHPCAKGFRKKESIVSHARLHQASRIVVRIDLKHFFPSTKDDRLRACLGRMGWNRAEINKVIELTTKYSSRQGARSLPQGAPTSPILSNILNYWMDHRLARLAVKSNAVYSRYADDITFSFDTEDRRFIRGVIRRIKQIVSSEGYRIHWKKLRVMRRHQAQIVNGLVVNDKVQLPRKLRRKLRAAEHHLRTGRPSSYIENQLQGWRALQQMIMAQRDG